jgi:hypothetical protein
VFADEINPTRRRHVPIVEYMLKTAAGPSRLEIIALLYSLAEPRDRTVARDYYFQICQNERSPIPSGSMGQATTLVARLETMPFNLSNRLMRRS